VTLPRTLNPFGLDTHEIASGALFGTAVVEGDLPSDVGSPLAALEAAVLPALERPPCLVSFSGGRDSSAVLALAASVARREALPLPIPITNVFPSAPASRESEWQERVVAHLDLPEWIRLDHDDELDAVGPVARRVLSRHGLLWPCNAHFHAPLLQAATGGSLLTGIGGDEVFGASRWGRAVAVLTARALPERRDFLRIALALAPRRTRAAYFRRRYPLRFGWLREPAQKALTHAWAAQAAGEPLRRLRRLRWWRSLRYVVVGLAALDLLAADSGAQIVHPLSDRRFLEAFARVGSTAGFASRGEAMRSVFGNLLPEALYSRSTKVHFDEVFRHRHTLEFAGSWEGEGADPEFVDVDALRKLWLSGEAEANSFTLLQWAWLARETAHRSARERLEQPVESVVG
jgi:Asparagine synthase